MRSFDEYVEFKKFEEFDKGLVELLSPVTEGVVDFEDFVEQILVPTFHSSYIVDQTLHEQVILNELLDTLRQKWSNMFGGQPKEDPQVAAQKDAMANQRYQQMLNTNRQNPGTYSKPRDITNNRVSSITKKIQDVVEKELIPTIKSIADRLKASAYDSNDKMLYQAANLFLARLMKTAKGIEFTFSGQQMGDKMKQAYQQDKTTHDFKRKVQSFQPNTGSTSVRAMNAMGRREAM